ncbi:nectin-4 isoform X2 [Dunckerocampus dactyliophorus]|uniref:nectin-4 isoform X2 n=1 Tax=Dunckerocampus dactyliophorus TaxID=161453 RepID=UPI002404DFF0|nr:nectin-4 isoform X2 [Dunckerocampus dactyliophorus]
MTFRLRGPSLRILVLLIFVAVAQGGFIEQPPNNAIRSLAEEETVLPCRYQPGDNVVVQVTWYKETPNGVKEQIITAHHNNGQTAFGTWSRRVRFKSSDPTVDSSLVVMSTDVSDEGTYICRITIFPLGNFDRAMSLTVWTIPISSLDPVILVEGQSFRQVASCRSLARPPPLLSWDTELSGQSVNRSSENGAVSTHYSLHPLRRMNGKKLDCLVWHPTLTGGPRRLQNKLVVHFPPDPEVSGYNGDWYVDLEHAALRCVSGGNPKPQIFTWARLGDKLPEGVIPHPNGTLEFGRPLSLSDSGTYQCLARNEVGVGTAEVEIAVAESHESQTMTENVLMIIVGAIAGGLLILMLVIVICVTCHHKKKNKMLKRELTEKKEEISTLSRQASFRRMNSVSTDARGATEESIPLRVEGTLRTSMSSLGEMAQSRDSRSTLSGGRGGGGAYDYLGRPVLHNNSRRGRERPLDRDEESRIRVETYVRNSNISLQESRLHPPLIPSSLPVVQSSTEVVRHINGSAEGGSRPTSTTRSLRHSSLSCSYPPVTDDEDEVDEGLGGPGRREHPGDRESVTSSSQASEAGYQLINGTVRLKPTPSPTMVSPHASLVHKAQIV